VFEVHVSGRTLEPFAAIVGPERVHAAERLAASMRAQLGSGAVWNVSSTATGGGVAEMLRSLLRYARGLCIDTRWAVIEGPPDFFRVTKRLHNALHGARGDGSPLGPDERATYERVMHDNAVAFDAVLRPGDIVVCHDPQTAGLVPHLVKRGARVVWRCHVGSDVRGEETDRGWDFLRPYLEKVPFAIFTRAPYAPSWLAVERAIIMAPNIDPFSAKNQDMPPEAVRAILVDTGLVEGPPGEGTPTFVRDDGSTGRVNHAADVTHLGRAPCFDTPLVVQVSRWDTLKDPCGVIAGFGHLLEQNAAPRDVELVLAGPNVRAVADDPDGEKVFESVCQLWRALPHAVRRKVNLAMLPMKDLEENAAIVNALQRHATVVVQKSLHEGFGLTVTEAMWKARPVVASAVGGIQDQIRDGIDGLLLRDPTDAVAFAGALERILGDTALAERLGRSAHERVRDNFLAITSLERWAGLVRRLLA
jgi:trehalose synthase